MKVIPYLYFSGNAEEAMAFYAKALGGSVGNVVRYSEGDYPGMKDKILHGEVRVEGVELYFSDSPVAIAEGRRVTLNLDLDGEEAIHRAFDALTSGATSVDMDLQETFWGAVYGSLTDRYGVTWGLNWQKSPRET